MDFEYNDKTLEYKEKLEGFMEENVYPADRERHEFVEDPSNLWQQPPIVEELKAKAQAARGANSRLVKPGLHSAYSAGRNQFQIPAA